MKPVIYKNWEITYSPKPIPVRVYDYDAVHHDYDGPEDGRCITGDSVDDQLEQLIQARYPEANFSRHMVTSWKETSCPTCQKISWL